MKEAMLSKGMSTPSREFEKAEMPTLQSVMSQVQEEVKDCHIAVQHLTENLEPILVPELATGMAGALQSNSPNPSVMTQEATGLLELVQSLRVQIIHLRERVNL